MAFKQVNDSSERRSEASGRNMPPKQGLDHGLDLPGWSELSLIKKVAFGQIIFERTIVKLLAAGTPEPD